MISLIEAIFGSKIGRFLAEVLFAVIAITVIVLHFKHAARLDELGQLQKTAGALVTHVVAQNQQDTKTYQAAVTANQEKYDESHAQVVALYNALADSVRQYDAYRRAHPAVASAPGAGAAASPGECGPEDCGAVIERLAVRGNALAGSVGALSADLQSCQRDRDALTGEPK